MAITGTCTDSIILGPGMKVAVYSVTFDSSYAGTAGEALNMSTELPTEVYGAVVASQAGGYEIKYGKAASGAPTSGVLRVYYPHNATTANAVAAAEYQDVTTAKDLHATTCVVIAFGH
jgi:hypothetical protein